MMIELAQTAGTETGDPLVLAAIVVGSGIIGPLVLQGLNARAKRKDKQLDAALRKQEKADDYARQDAVAAAAAEVARKAEEAAALLLERQNKVARKTNEVARNLKETDALVAETASETNNKLDELTVGQKAIHILVNSQMTASLESELRAEKGKRATLIEIIALKKVMGQKASAETLAALTSTDERIAELEITLTDRERQTKMVEALQGKPKRKTAKKPPPKKPKRKP